MKVVVQGHLGGYVEGGDPATYYPELWSWLVKSAGVRSVIDIGCGDGRSTLYFAELGCDVLGVDGVPQSSPLIARHDFAFGPLVPSRSFDLAWCCEFVEHVEECFAPNFVATLASVTGLLLMTHAFPGQGGHHHVNCRPPEYWARMMSAAGFQLDPRLTATTRELARANGNPYNHYVRSGLAFRRWVLPRGNGSRQMLGPESKLG
jgi:SAM-dependent methyltransferase